MIQMFCSPLQSQHPRQMEETMENSRQNNENNGKCKAISTSQANGRNNRKWEKWNNGKVARSGKVLTAGDSFYLLSGSLARSNETRQGRESFDFESFDQIKWDQARLGKFWLGPFWKFWSNETKQDWKSFNWDNSESFDQMSPGKTRQDLCLLQWLADKLTGEILFNFCFWPNWTKILENQVNSYCWAFQTLDAQFRIQIFVPCNDWRTADEWAGSKKYKKFPGIPNMEFQIWDSKDGNMEFQIRNSKYGIPNMGTSRNRDFKCIRKKASLFEKFYFNFETTCLNLEEKAKELSFSLLWAQLYYVAGQKLLLELIYLNRQNRVQLGFSNWVLFFGSSSLRGVLSKMMCSPKIFDLKQDIQSNRIFKRI